MLRFVSFFLFIFNSFLTLCAVIEMKEEVSRDKISPPKKQCKDHSQDFSYISEERFERPCTVIRDKKKDMYFKIILFLPRDSLRLLTNFHFILEEIFESPCNVTEERGEYAPQITLVLPRDRLRIIYRILVLTKKY